MDTEIRTVHSQGFQSPRPLRWVESPLVRWRWLIFILLCLGIGAFELFDAPFSFKNPATVEYEELVLFFIVLVAVWSMMEILLRAIIARDQAVELLEIKHKLSLQLALAPDWNSLVDLILDFCQAQIDLESVVLLLHNPKIGCFEAVAWSQNEEHAVANDAAGLRADIFCACDDGAEHLHKFEALPETPEVLTSPGFCLPLILGNRAVAKLNFYLPEGNSPTKWQTEILNSCASDMAIALTSAQLSQERTELLINQAQSDQRRRISRDLHDTLGQKLVYLRFKLDQYAHGNGQTQLADIQNDLEQMEVVANESYELVRGTLAVLNNNESPSLFKLLMGHSRLAVDRAHLEFTFGETGQPQVLPFEELQQIFYIFGEALSNVERHAAAKNVDVALIWDQTELTIRVTDDGRGFDTAGALPDGHYGLTTMRERAEALGGHIDLQSTTDHGTRLTIQLPLGNIESDRLSRSFARSELL